MMEENVVGEDLMNRNVLVIGNGFDLYHGFETGYPAFVKYAKENNPNNNMFVNYFSNVLEENTDGKGRQWIDCEQEIKRAVLTIVRIFSTTDYKQASDGLIFRINSSSSADRMIISNFNKIINDFMLNDAISLKQKYFHKFIGVNIKLILEDLKKELDDLIDMLNKYLINIVKIENCLKISPQIEKYNYSYVVNFNYTDTYKKYGIKEDDVLFVHGKLGVKENNIVLGFDDDDERDLDTIYFKKYFQRIQKLTGIIDKSKFEKDIAQIFNDCEPDDVISHFFGLSMSNTDGDMIREIESLSDRCIVYYRNQKDYEQKVINLIDVFGKITAIEKIQTGEIELVEIDKAI